MAYHVIQEPRAFQDRLRRYEPTDRGHAEVFNAVAGQLINNDAYLRQELEGLAESGGAALEAHKGDTGCHVTQAEKAGWNGKAERTPATGEADGLLSAADKAKLDGIEAGATQGSKNALEFGTADGMEGMWDRQAGAPTGVQPIRYNGYLRATRVYGMYYSDNADYAEAYPVEGEYEPGDLIAITPDGFWRNTLPGNRRILGFVSDSFACCIGCQGENRVPIALSGRLWVKAQGPVEPGDLLVAGELPGTVKAGYIPGGVAAQALEGKPGRQVGRVLAKVIRM